MSREDIAEMADAYIAAGAVPTICPDVGSCPTPLLWCSVSPYFLPLEAVLVGFLAGFAFALAIAMPPSFAYTPEFHAKV